MRSLLAIGLATFALALGGPPAALAEDLPEDTLRRLEAMLEQQAAELARLRAELADLRQRQEAPAPAPTPASPGAALPPAPTGQAPAGSGGNPALVGAGTDVSRSGSALAAAPALSDGVRWGGYLTLEYIDRTHKNSNFDLHRLVLQATAPINDCIDFTTEIELEHGGIGGEMDGDVKVEYAEVAFRLHDAFVPKVGALLIPFGRYNLYHDDPINDFTLRPWTARYFVPTGFGQPGIGAEGVVPLSSCARLLYNAAFTGGFEDDFTPSDGVRKARQSWRRDNNDQKQLWGRVALMAETAWLDGLELGASGTWGRYDKEGRNDLWGYGVDWMLRRGPWELRGEYLAYDIERDADDPVDAVRGQQGLWAELAWHFFPCAWRSCRSCLVRDTSLFTLAARYQWMDLDDRRRGAAYNDDLQSAGLALNYRITERSVFRVDYSWIFAERATDEREFTFSFSTYF